MRLILLASIAALVPVHALVQTGFSPAKESLKLFNKYIPVIEEKNNAIVDKPNVITGDINGDKKGRLYYLFRTYFQ